MDRVADALAVNCSSQTIITTEVDAWAVKAKVTMEKI